jgi:HTH-type transcriptional regulator/antitoxin HigA
MQYDDLLRDVSPEVIETEKQFEAISQRFGMLVRKGRNRTVAENKLMRLLGLLIEDYDRRHAMPPDDGTPADRLRFLTDHSEKPTNQLLQPVFGQRSHIHEALTGKREISLAQARKLGEIFHVSPRLFV